MRQGDTKIRQGSEEQTSDSQDGELGPLADHPSCAPPLQRGSNYGSLLTTEGQFQIFAKTAYYKVSLRKTAGPPDGAGLCSDEGLGRVLGQWWAVRAVGFPVLGSFLTVTTSTPCSGQPRGCETCESETHRADTGSPV